MQKLRTNAYKTAVFCLLASAVACGTRVNLGAVDGSADDASLDAVVVPRERCGNGIDDNQNGQIDEGCPTGACAAQDAQIQNPPGNTQCDAWHGYYWDGLQCWSGSGCSCEGRDCGSNFSTREACLTAYASCRDGGAGDAAVGCTGSAPYCGSQPCTDAVEGRAQCVNGGWVCAPPLVVVEWSICTCTGQRPRADCTCDRDNWTCPVQATETCRNGIDDNQNGQVDEGCVSSSCDGQVARGFGNAPRAGSFGYAWTGRSCVEVTGNTCEGTDCASLYISENACLAAYPGCSQQPCGGSTGVACQAGNYCYTPAGSCGAAGQCTPVNTLPCTFQVDLVCGCNSTVYSNRCAAETAGVALRNLGDCTCPNGCDDGNNFTSDRCVEGQCRHSP